MTKTTTNSVRNPYGPTHNANIMKTIQLQGLDKTIEEMTDEGIETIKEFRALLLINDVHCSVSKRITIMKDFR